MILFLDRTASQEWVETRLARAAARLAQASLAASESVARAAAGLQSPRSGRAGPGFACLARAAARSGFTFLVKLVRAAPAVGLQVQSPPSRPPPAWPVFTRILRRTAPVTQGGPCHGSGVLGAPLTVAGGGQAPRTSCPRTKWAPLAPRPLAPPVVSGLTWVSTPESRTNSVTPSWSWPWPQVGTISVSQAIRCFRFASWMLLTIFSTLINHWW